MTSDFFICKAMLALSEGIVNSHEPLPVAHAGEALP